MIPDNLKQYFLTWEDFTSIIQEDEKLLHFLSVHSLDKDFNELIDYVCNHICDTISRTVYSYSKKFLDENGDVQILCTIVKKFPRADIPYWRLLCDYFQHKHSAVLTKLPSFLETWCSKRTQAISDADLAFHFLSPFKNAFPGFWDKVYQCLCAYPTESGVLSLCKAAPILFTSTDNEQLEILFDELLRENPNSIVVKELQLILFYVQKKWGNCVALAEQIQEPYFQFIDDLLFAKAWCYGKLKETEHEIEAYEECLNIWPDHPFARNNLGYAYYKNKQYPKAFTEFAACLEKNIDLPNAANNYVRTLIAMKRFSDAKKFINQRRYNIDKKLCARVMNADDVNLEEDDESSQAVNMGEKQIRSNVKLEQFTNERILEDELVERMNAGHPTFGRKLKILRRKGVYGRQYILSNGKRPDLIAEDDHGGLYVIELKKDSGYDDAYEQITDYLRWFDENWTEKPKSISGIICLNNPSESLLKKVHSNPRVELYEYHISYTKR